MFDRTSAIERWRAQLTARAVLKNEQLDELEAHLCDAMDELGPPLSDEEKFLVATHRLGQPTELCSEYERAVPWSSWRVPIFWVTAGVAVMLGVQAIIDLAVPVGALVASRANLPFVWLKAWTIVACSGGPAIALAAVAAWMRRYSAGHSATKRALFITVACAGALRIASLPVLKGLNDTVWRGFDANAWRSFGPIWQWSSIAGLLLVAGVGAVIMVRYRDAQTRAQRT